MDKALIDRIVEMRRRGAVVRFVRGYGGQARVKVKYGPFHLLTRRYRPDEPTFEELKQRIRSNPHSG